MRKMLIVLLNLMVLISLCGCKDTTLPLPELEEGMRGQLGIDKNINESTIDKYLGRKDSVYYDMRMLKDEANYEAIGGDSYLSGYVKGFEVIPYPYLCNVEGLPEAVGQGYEGPTLFSIKDGEYIANYEESYHIIESLFPKDKYIFLMCGGGGYAGMTKQLLVALGYDENKIYNTGGYWYYQGENKVETFYEENDKRYYDFSNVPYHNIDHSLLTPVDGYEPNTDKKEDDNVIDDEEIFIEIHDNDELSGLIEEVKTFALYVYIPGCSSCASFYPIVKEFAQANDIPMYAVDLTAIYKSNNPVSERISYSPSMFIFIDGEVVAYLDPSSDEDLTYYQTLEGLSGWFSQYLDVEILRSDTFNEVSDCESACSLDD
ncbi:MAG: hypothetical protein IJI46_02880 [Erysipelotrichaceae bacterium]|nr:hypothetical protein [Erysipelotrichaceae bacterium]